MSEPTSDQEKFDSGYQAGVIAALSGKSKADNPYYKDTPQWRGWETGFRDTLDAEA